MEEEIKILQNLAGRTRPIAEDLETAVCSIDEQVAIRKLIARYKEVEEDLQINEDYIKTLQKKLTSAIEIKNIHQDYIPKSKVKEKLKELDKEEKEAQDSISDEEREEYSDASIGYLLMDIATRREVLQELLEES